MMTAESMLSKRPALKITVILLFFFLGGEVMFWRFVMCRVTLATKLPLGLVDVEIKLIMPRLNQDAIRLKIRPNTKSCFLENIQQMLSACSLENCDVIDNIDITVQKQARSRF